VIHRPTAEIFSRVSPCGEDDAITLTMFNEAGVEIQYVDIFVNKTTYLGGRKYQI
jgi:hypothetical protein